MAALTINVVSDVVCPWCYLGKHHLDQALALAAEIDTAVHWRPYQLDPTIPPEGMPRDAYMKGKFGDQSRLDAAHDRLKELGRKAGIPYAFDKITVSPNTLDAHRVVRWAGVERRQTEVVEALFRGYFVEGRDLGSPEVLADIAAGQGMDRAVVLRLLAGDNDKDAVRAEIDTARRIGVTGVPCFILGGRYAVSGAQPPEVLADAIRQAAAAAAEAAE